MANDLTRIRYMVVFNSNGLDENGVVEDINGNYGQVLDRTYTQLDEGHPVTVMHVDSSLNQYALIKEAYNCVEYPKYWLTPMASRKDKILAEIGLRKGL